MDRTLHAARYHARWHRQRMSVWWWLETWPYTRFVLRELTSVCVAWTSLLLVGLVWAVGSGPAALASFLAWMASPWLVVVHAFVLGGLLYHSVTWFKLSPRAMVVRLSGRRVPDALIVGGNVGAWVVVSIVLLWLAGR